MFFVPVKGGKPTLGEAPTYNYEYIVSSKIVKCISGSSKSSDFSCTIHMLILEDESGGDYKNELLVIETVHLARKLKQGGTWIHKQKSSLLQTYKRDIG